MLAASTRFAPNKQVSATGQHASIYYILENMDENIFKEKESDSNYIYKVANN